MILEEFDITKIEIPFSMMMVSARASGKSSCCKHFLAVKDGLIDQFDLIYVFGNQYNCDFYRSCIPDERIFCGLDEFEDKMEIISFKQQEMVEKKGLCLDILFIIEDLMTSRRGKSNEVLQKGFSADFRHNNISIICIQQRADFIRSNLVNSTHLCIWPWRGLKMQSDKKYMAEEILMEFVENKEEAYKLLDSFKQYECLIIDFYNSGNSLYRFKADPKFIDFSVKNDVSTRNNISNNNIENVDTTSLPMGNSDLLPN